MNWCPFVVADSMSGPMIEVEGLTKRFGTFTAVDHISFSVGKGSIFGFLGPNGAGKSTTMRVILGLDSPDAGEALHHLPELQRA